MIRDKKAVAGGEDSRNKAARRLVCDACLSVHIISMKGGDLRSRELYLSDRLPTRRSTREDRTGVDCHAGIDEGLPVSCRDRFLSAQGYLQGIDH